MAHLDQEFEQDVVARALNDRDFLDLAVPVLRVHQFSTKPLAWIYKTLSEVYHRNRELPTPQIMGVHAERDFPSNEEHELICDIIIKLFRRKVEAPRTALDEIREFIRMTALRDAAIEAAENIDLGDVDAAERALVSGAEVVRSSSLMSMPVNWGETSKQRLQTYREISTGIRIRTPLRELDAMLGGGLPPCRLAGIEATTNVGKSAWLTDVGYNALFLSDCVVLHVTTEESRDEAFARYDARHTLLDRTKLESHALDEEEAQIFEARFARKTDAPLRLFVHEMPPLSDVSGVRLAADVARRAYLDLPLLIVVDSPEHLMSKARDYEHYRHEIGAVYLQLKALTMDAVLRPCAMWVSTQARRQDAGKILTAESPSESYDKSRHADVMIGIGDMPGKNSRRGEIPLRVNIAKNRIASKKTGVLLVYGDMSACKFRHVAEYEKPLEEKSESGREGPLRR